MTRPSKNTQTANEKKCIIFYEDYKSAGYAAKKLELNRHTVEKYYQKFAAKEIEETNKSFIEKQRATKNRVIEKMDELIEEGREQLKRCKGMLGSDGDNSTEGINFERILQKCVIDLSNLYQQKAEIEMTPTLDIHIAAEIEKRYGELSKTTK
jgi:hypothetical protein